MNPFPPGDPVRCSHQFLAEQITRLDILIRSLGQVLDTEIDKGLKSPVNDKEIE